MIARPPPPRRPAPPAPMVSTAQRQREVAKLLMQLDAMLKKTGDLAAAARERVSVGGFGRYRKFTRKVRDFFALAAVTQERLDAAPSEMEELIGPMTTALERLHARMVVLFVEESAAFFAAFNRVKALPIGTHEMCGVELRALREICKFLDDPLYEGERGQALRLQAERIADLMGAVMDRVPPLPDFGDSPSIGPKGVVNQPIRPPRRATPPAPAPAPAVAAPMAPRPRPPAPPSTPAQGPVLGSAQGPARRPVQPPATRPVISSTASTAASPTRQPAPPPQPSMPRPPMPPPSPPATGRDPLEVRPLTFDSLDDDDDELHDGLDDEVEEMVDEDIDPDDDEDDR